MLRKNPFLPSLFSDDGPEPLELVETGVLGNPFAFGPYFAFTGVLFCGIFIPVEPMGEDLACGADGDGDDFCACFWGGLFSFGDCDEDTD